MVAEALRWFSSVTETVPSELVAISLLALPPTTVAAEPTPRKGEKAFDKSVSVLSDGNAVSVAARTLALSGEGNNGAADHEFC